MIVIELAGARYVGFFVESWAAHLGYDRTYVASVERGERNVTLDMLSALADQIDVDPLKLLAP